MKGQPQNLFKGCEFNDCEVNVYQAPNGNGKKTVPAATKLSEVDAAKYSRFCFENDISQSDFIRNAMSFYHAFYPISKKMIKCRGAVFEFFELLKKLP